MVDQFHGIEEYLPKADCGDLYQKALQELEEQRNNQIKDTIKKLISELSEVDGQIKTLEKKRKNIQGRLNGYSRNQVAEAAGNSLDQS